MWMKQLEQAEAAQHKQEEGESEKELLIDVGPATGGHHHHH